MFERIRVIFSKEVVDNLRDRRTLAGTLLYPLLGPLMLALMFTVLGNTMSEQTDKILQLPLVGAENAPALIQFLEQHGAEIVPGPQDPETEVRAGNYDLVIVVPEGYAEDFNAGKPATVKLIYDDSRQTSSVPVSRARTMLLAYSDQIGALRLVARGIDPNVINALAIERIDVSTPQSQAALLLNMMPYFVIFSIFIGGMYLAIDTTAGERERGSLEPLLINPVARGEFVLGKLLATLLFTAVGVLETLLAFYVTLNLLPTESLGLKISLGFGAIALIYLISIPMMLLAASLQMIVATFTRSFKEAQTYLSLLPLAPALPGMVLAFLPIKVKLWMMLVPTFGQQLLINQVMRGEMLNWGHVLLSAAATMAVGALLTWVAISLYGRERILFGRATH